MHVCVCTNIYVRMYYAYMCACMQAVFMHLGTYVCLCKLYTYNIYVCM